MPSTSVSHFSFFSSHIVHEQERWMDGWMKKEILPRIIISPALFPIFPFSFFFGDFLPSHSTSVFLFLRSFIYSLFFFYGEIKKHHHIPCLIVAGWARVLYMSL